MATLKSGLVLAENETLIAELEAELKRLKKVQEEIDSKKEFKATSKEDREAFKRVKREMKKPVAERSVEEYPIQQFFKYLFTVDSEDGIEFKAKPMGSRELKEQYREDLDKLIGKMATVKYFYLSDEGTPLQPVLKAIRDYD